MELHVYHHIEFINNKLDELITLVKSLQVGENKMANELQSLTEQVAANTSAEQSAVLLLNHLHELLVAAQSDPAKLTDLITQLGTSKDALAAAITANTV